MKRRGSAKCRTGSFFLALIMLFTALSVNYVDVNAAKESDAQPETVLFALNEGSCKNTSLKSGDWVKFVFDESNRPSFVLYKTGAEPWSELDIESESYDVIYTFEGDEASINSCEYQIPADAALGKVYSFGALWASDADSLEGLNPSLVKPVAQITVAEEKSEEITVDAGDNITARIVPAPSSAIAFTGSVIEDETRLQAMQESVQDFEVKDGAFYDLHAEGFTGAVSISVPVHFTPDEKDAVCVIHFPNSASGDYTEYEYLPCTYENGVVSFEADSFSDFFVFYGNQNNAFNVGSTNQNHDIYVYPGMQFTLTNIRGWTKNINVGDTEYGVTFVKDENNNGVYSVAPNAPTGEEVVVLKRNSWVNTYTVTVHILSQEAFIERLLANTKVTMACLNSDLGGKYPDEPSITDYSYLFPPALSDKSPASTYLETSIIKSSALQIGGSSPSGSSVFGTNVIGIFDSSGANIIPYIKNYDSISGQILNHAATNNGIAITGEVINMTNVNNYKAIPYVIKLQPNDNTWHIDFAIVPKSTVTLSYDRNLPSGFQLDSGISLPAPGGVSGKEGFTTTVTQSITLNKTYSGMMNGVPAEIAFLGWSTAPSGDVEYTPGARISVNKDTTLYAIWSSENISGTLVVSKAVTTEDGVEIPDEMFAFEISGVAAGSYSWEKIEGIQIIERGTWAPGTQITLKAGQRIEIHGFAHNTKLTVTEDLPSGSPFQPEQKNIEITISGAQKREAAFINVYTKPTANLMIQKQYPDGADYTIDENQTFIFQVKGDADDPQTQNIDLTVTIHGKGQAVIADLPIGSYTVIEQVNWSWRYIPKSVEQKITLASGGDNTVSFVNTREKVNWLDGNAFHDNVFTRSN